jgi:hypothetical protein
VQDADLWQPWLDRDVVPSDLEPIGFAPSHVTQRPHCAAAQRTEKSSPRKPFIHNFAVAL